MSKMTDVLIFSAGVLTGAAMAWQFAKKRYEQIAQEEIDSVKEKFSLRMSQEEIEAVANRYAEIGHQYLVPSEDEPSNDILAGEAYVISPEEFGEIEGYTLISLMYFADGVLTDEGYEVVDYPEDTVGADFASHFGEYEDDSVYIRNDIRHCDYEILLDQRKYADVANQKPHRKEGS